MKNFSAEWWRYVGQRALHKFENYSWCGPYLGVHLYCKERAEEAKE